MSLLFTPTPADHSLAHTPSLHSDAQRPRRRRLGALLAAVVLSFAGLTVLTGLSNPATAGGPCYTFTRTLSQGASGADVSSLQVRVAGWSGVRSFAVDGQFGPGTATAVANFQRSYGLTADGIAGPQTFAKLYSLESADCSTAHFDWAEVDDSCFGGFSGGTVSEAQVRENLRRGMWRAEALRQRLGNKPLTVTSGFRSRTCNARVGGSSTSKHMTGQALDFVPYAGTTTMCSIGRAARNGAWTTILGPGFEGHSDHIHVDYGDWLWSASQCGI